MTGKHTLWIIWILVCLVMLSGCACQHEWASASCTQGEVCALCGEVQGEALGHDWQDASCTVPQTCSRCSEVQGDTLPHSWQDATCTTPKTCSICSRTEGEALNHPDAEWVMTMQGCALGYDTYALHCKTCHEVVDTRKDAYTTYVKEGVIVMTPNEWISRLHMKFAEVAQGNYISYLFTMKNPEGLEWVNGYILPKEIDPTGSFTTQDCLGAIYFLEPEATFFMGMDDLEKHSIHSLRCDMNPSLDEDTRMLIAAAIIMTCDPVIDFDSALNYAKTAPPALSPLPMGTNGLHYSWLNPDSSTPSFVVSVAAHS